MSLPSPSNSMSTTLSRRQFLEVSLGAAAASAIPLNAASTGAPPFSFVLLGDLHFDKLEHHDFAWLEATHAGDRSQIQNYSKLTAEVMPAMFAAVKQRLHALRGSAAPPAFVIQVGDLVEGLCGSEALAAVQNREALEFIAAADLGLPFLFTKGNHDVTGDGAVAAFDGVLLPFMKKQAQRIDATASHARANYSLTHGGAQFAFFDAYDKASLDWLEATVAARTAAHFFLIVHPPVVPYGARATWHLYSDEKSASKRAKLLDLLGAQEAIVFGGHLHKFSALTRNAAGKRFRQLAVSSVVSRLDEIPRDVLSGFDAYTGDQVELEPKHSPDTADKRRAIYDEERKQVTAFEYANSAGFAVVTVNGGSVEAAIHAGSRQEAWRTVTLRE